MTNDRNMGNIETANQSNLVSAHGIFNSIILRHKILFILFYAEKKGKHGEKAGYVVMNIIGICQRMIRLI